MVAIRPLIEKLLLALKDQYPLLPEMYSLCKTKRVLMGTAKRARLFGSWSEITEKVLQYPVFSASAVEPKNVRNRIVRMIVSVVFIFAPFKGKMDVFYKVTQINRKVKKKNKKS